VHAPGGFYVVSTSAYAEDQPPCEVIFDRSRSRFSCPSLGLVWDRMGRQIEPAPGASAEGIGPHPVGVTFDKQVVYSPYFGSVAFTDLWS
jgi:hypothetical protein